MRYLSIVAAIGSLTACRATRPADVTLSVTPAPTHTASTTARPRSLSAVRSIAHFTPIDNRFVGQVSPAEAGAGTFDIPYMAVPYPSKVSRIRGAELRSATDGGVIVMWSNSPSRAVGHDYDGATRIEPQGNVVSTIPLPPPAPSSDHNGPRIATFIARDGARSEVAIDRPFVPSATPGIGHVSIRGRELVAFKTPSAPNPIVIESVGNPEQAAWTPDRSTVFLPLGWNLPPGNEIVPIHCATRVELSTGTVTRLRCEFSEHMELWLTPSGDSLVVAMQRAEDHGLADLEVIDSRTGTVRAEMRATWGQPLYSVDVRTWSFSPRGIVDEHARLVHSVGSDLFIIDIPHQRAVRLPLGGPAMPVSEHTPRLPTGELVTLREGKNGWFDAIAIDLDVAMTTGTPLVPPALDAKVDTDAPRAADATRFWTESSPCARGTTLRITESPGGVERACIDTAGRLHGRYAYDVGEQPLARGAFVRGKRDGGWLMWFSDGAPRAALTFHADTPAGTQREWFATGALARRSSRSATTSETSQFYPNGQVARRTAQLRRGKQPRWDGITTWWRRDGKQIRTKEERGDLDIDITELDDGRRREEITNWRTAVRETRTYRGEILDGPASTFTFTSSSRGIMGSGAFVDACYVDGTRIAGKCK